MKSDFVSAALANFKHTTISLCKTTIKVSGVINTGDPFDLGIDL